MRLICLLIQISRITLEVFNNRFRLICAINDRVGWIKNQLTISTMVFMVCQLKSKEKLGKFHGESDNCGIL